MRRLDARTTPVQLNCWRQPKRVRRKTGPNLPRTVPVDASASPSTAVFRYGLVLDWQSSMAQPHFTACSAQAWKLEVSIR